MKKGLLFFGIICLIAWLPIISACAPAAEKEYPAKDILYIIPNETGGGFDVWARAVGKYMPQYLPKKVNIIYENLPAGGGMEGTTKIYASAPDGYTIGILNIPGYILNQLFMPVKFDLKKMSYIGSVNADIYYIQVKKDSPIKSLKELQQKRTVKFSTAGLGTTGWMATVIGAKELGIEPRFVHFNAMRDAALSLMRGEVDALFGAEGTTLPYMKSGDLKALAALVPERVAESPDVPTIGELGYPKLTMLNLYRIIVGPPGIPEKILKILEDAQWKALQDEGLIAWSKEGKRPMRGLAKGEEAKKTVLNGLETFAKYKDVLAEGVKK